MKIQRDGRVVLGLITSLLLVLSVMEAGAQQRNRPSRRITHPMPSRSATNTPTENGSAREAEIISTADETPAYTVAPARSRTAGRPSNRTEQRATTPSLSEEEQLRHTVNRLSAQVAKLTEDVNAFKEQQRTLVDLERLTRAEQRADNLRAQLRTVTDREFELQARAEQLAYELQPEVIQQRTALVGSVRPDAVRESLQRQLETERNRVRQQLELLAQSRTRLERSILDADAEVERLRARIDVAVDDSASPQADTRRRSPRTSTPTDTSTPTPAEPPTHNTTNMPR